MIQDIKLTDYIKTFGEHWADEMPENCPPEDVAIADEKIFYRLTINEDRIVPEDWNNYLTLYPERTFSAKEKILAAGLSLADSKEAAVKKMKLPKIKKRGLKGIASISIIPKDGVILQTKESSHYTWWRTTMCDLSKAKIV